MEQTIKDRILQIGKREMPEGYVKSVVGIVPADWKHYTFGDIYSERKEPGNENLPLLVVSIHSGVSDGKVDEDKLTKRTKQIEDKSQYKKAVTGDLVLNMMRAWQGAIGTVRTTGMFSPAYIVAEPDDKIYPPFMDYFTRIPRMINQIDRQSYGVTDFRKRLYWASFIIIDCILPPIEEQQKIAAILTTQDKVIELKEKRLAEKLRQKKYLMQQLLTGRKRLPSYWGEWNFPKAKEIFQNVTDKNHKGDLMVLSATQDKGIMPRNEVDIDIKYDVSSLANYKKVCQGNFVISLRSFQGGIEYSAYTGLVSPAYTVLSSKKELCDEYYKQYFKSADFINRLNVAVYGIRDGKQISFEDFGQLRIPYPPINEQTAIAQVLSAADHEISLLRQDIEQEKQKKKALMQLLLTGIVRVNV